MKQTTHRLIMCAAAVVAFLPSIVLAQPPAPYPVTVDSQRDTVAALDVYQANERTFRVSYKSAGEPDDITAATPFMRWHPYGATNSTVVTASWSVVSSVSGIVDFAFSPSDLNFATGQYVYQVGFSEGPTVVKQGAFTIRASAASTGATPVVFSSTNVNWGLINWTGLPAYEYQTNTIALGAALSNAIALKLPTSTHAASTAALWSAVNGIVSADNALTNVNGDGNRITASITGNQAYVQFNATGLSTGVPIYVEVGTGTLVAASIAPFITSATASNSFAPSNELYAVNGQNITGRWFALNNTVGSDFAWVGGGFVNISTGTHSSVGGGTGNKAQAGYSTIAGGFQNAATGIASTVVGGYQNSANTYGTSSGGLLNNAAGLYSSIPGGYYNTASDYSFAGGIRASATNTGSFVWSGSGNTDEGFGSRGDNTFNVRSVGGIYFLAPTMTFLDTNGVQTYKIDTVAGTAKFGPNSFTVYSTGDIEQDATNSAVLGLLTVKDLTVTGTVVGLTSYATNGQWNADINAVGLGASNYADTVGAAVGLVATNLHLAQGIVATNAQVTASNALAAANGVGLVATNLHLAQGVETTNNAAGIVAVGLVASNAAVSALAIGAGATNYADSIGAAVGLVATNFHVEQGIVATNAQVTASNALASALGVGVSVTNLHLAQGVLITNNTASIVAVGLVATNAASGVVAVGLVATNAAAGVVNVGLVATNASAGVVAVGLVASNAVPWLGLTNAVNAITVTNINFSPSSYLSVAAYQAAITNSLRLYAGSVTQNQIGVHNNGYFATTNLWISLGGTNWVRFTGAVNAW